MADLDRLRVLQVAAAQSATVKDPSAGAQTDFALESDSVETSSPTASSASAESGHESTGAPGQDAQADLNGGNGEHTAGAGAAASKEGGQAAKGGEAGPQFHQVLDQARAAEHRPAIAAGAETRGETHGAAMLEQITRKLALAARKPGDEISIQLSPEHLGKVRVSLEMREDGMSARIAVENDSVRKQVEANLASLKDALKDQGIQLQGLEVSVDQRHSSLFNPDGSNAESFFRRQGRGEGGGRGGRNDESAPLEAAPESDTGRRWGYNTMEYIG
jgi:flagellar hook-length control protein FliK